jgi:hypothetical protein
MIFAPSSRKIPELILIEKATKLPPVGATYTKQFCSFSSEINWRYSDHY